MNILKPPKLQRGDTIGVVAPAHPFPADTSSEYYKTYQKGVKQLESMGFQIKEAKNLRKVQWWRAGSPKERAQDINDMFADRNIKAIIAHDGGNDCISVLEHLEYDLIKNNPKPFIGFSNITNIHSALFSQVGLIGFHMGLLTYELGAIWPTNLDNSNIAYDYFYQVLTSNQPLGKLKSITPWECWYEGKAEGMLFGGNLSMLDSLIGTRYFPNVDELKGSIFFWELDNSPTYRIERVLTHLKYTGLLEVISGMVIGKLIDMKPTAQGELKEPTIKDQVLEILKDYKFPILANVDFGHKVSQIPMPIGIKARIDSEKLLLEFQENAVS